MQSIITITGHQNTGKVGLAFKLEKEIGAEWIKPFVDIPIPVNAEDYELDDYHHVTKEVMDELIKKNTVLCCTFINGHRYVFFKEQLKKPYNIMIVDDYALVDVRTRFNGRLFSIKTKSKNAKPSDRVGEYYFDHEFDEVFNTDDDDFYKLEARIQYETR